MALHSMLHISFARMGDLGITMELSWWFARLLTKFLNVLPLILLVLQDTLGLLPGFASIKEFARQC